VKKDRLVAYYRNSNDDNAEWIPEKNQELLCDMFAEKMNALIIKKYSDPGYSGEYLDRPEYKKMIEELLTNTEIDGLICYDLNRLSINIKAVMNLLFDLEEKKKKLYIARERFVEDWSTQNIIMKKMFLEWMDRDISNKIKINQRTGIQRYRNENQGRWGAPIKDIDWNKYDEYLALGLTMTEIAKLLGVTRKTLYLKLKERGG
jgi:DNA invertase Pin-like site-specific DNA recombinase